MITLKPYQNEVLDWVRTKNIAFISLEQGLGKTIIAIKDLRPPVIIVCPASLRLMWKQEILANHPHIHENTIQVRAKPAKLERNQLSIAPLPLVTIISYHELQKLTKTQVARFQQVVFDESHYIKNPKAVRTKLAMALISLVLSKEVHTKLSKALIDPVLPYEGSVRFLSGTPIRNRPIELWPVLYATGITKLSFWKFGMKFCGGWKTPWGSFDFSGATHAPQLREMISPFMIRLLKKDVLDDLPDKIYRIIELDLPPDKREKKLELENIEKGDFTIGFGDYAPIQKLNAHRKLRLAIDHIKHYLEQDRKVVVFAHHLSIIDELNQALEAYNPVVFKGGMTDAAKDKAKVTFQTDKTCRVFIGGIKAAGEGLTLTAASNVVFVESSWVKGDIDQCADRCHRIGQEETVMVDILTIHKSIDAHMLHKALSKQKIVNQYY